MENFLNLTHAQTELAQGGDYHLTEAEFAKAQSLSGLYKQRLVMGVELDEENGTWRNIDKYGNEISNEIIKRANYWSGLHPVEVDGQAMVEIPKFYFLFDNSDNKQRWWVSGRKFNIGGKTSSLHKGFIYNGVPKDCFQVGAYTSSLDAEDNTKYASVKDATIDRKTFLGAITSSENRGNGFTLLNMWQLNAIRMLCLVDTGHPDVKTAYGYGNLYGNTTGTTFSWRDIWDFWCGGNEWLQGAKLQYCGSEIQNYLAVSLDAGSPEFATTMHSFKVNPYGTCTTGQAISKMNPELAAEGLFVPAATESGNATWAGDAIYYKYSSSTSHYVACYLNMFGLNVQYFRDSSSDTNYSRLARVPE